MWYKGDLGYIEIQRKKSSTFIYEHPATLEPQFPGGVPKSSIQLDEMKQPFIINCSYGNCTL